MCDCGQPLHYPTVAARQAVEASIAENGPAAAVVFKVSIPNVVNQAGQSEWTERTFLIPRHYLALHSMPGRLYIEGLAAERGWPEVTPGSP
jgi:hypothetical protein